MSVNLNYFNENVKPNYKERSSAVILKKNYSVTSTYFPKYLWVKFTYNSKEACGNRDINNNAYK